MAAETTVSTVVRIIVEKLANEAFEQYTRSQGIHSELNELSNKLSHIQAQLNDASRKEATDESVRLWLNNLQHLAYDIHDILDDVSIEATHRELTQESESNLTSNVRKLIPTWFTNFSLSHKLHLNQRLDSISKELDDLDKNIPVIDLVVKEVKPENTSRRNETSLLDPSSIVVGREGDIKKLLNKLLKDDKASKENFSILPIVGTAGVGKTTLARHLYNHIDVEDHFDLRVWVWVSDDFDIFKISKSIFQAISGENKDFEDLNLVQIALKEKFKNKRFLLVLDDVWHENIDDWKNLVLPFHSGASASRIIITTQKDKLLIDLGFDHLDRLEILSHKDALGLFALHAVGVNNFNSSVTYKVQGEGIVKKCGGSPLALKVLGRLMNTKTTKEEWDEVLNSKIWDLENVDEIARALRLSYYDLSSDLKRVFAYCSLFPKQFLFDKDELVLLWMAEGFLNQSNATQSREQLGHEYFKTLLSRSFFQSVPNEDSLFMMHGLMNDLATFVAGDFYLRFDNHTKMEKASTKHRHISFMREKYVGYQKLEAFKGARGLRTLLAVSVGEDKNWSQFYLSNKILVDLLPELRLLRVLNLSYFEISEVPEFVGNLKHLKYLNLTQTKIKELPESVGTLYSLETLIIFGCKSLTKLPKSFLNLKKLRHFDMRGTPLKKMPLGIGKMENMRTLTKIIIEGDDGFAITELKELKNLCGKIFIEGLHEVKRAMDAREAQFSSKMITELEMKWIDKFDNSRKGSLEMEVLDELKPPSKYLKVLGVEYYGAVEFPNWVGDPSFTQLVHVSIRACRKCKSLPPFGQLPSLKKLFIQGMDEVKVIGSELTGSSLQILAFEDMPRWEVWSSDNIQSLEELRIINCSKLIDVSSLKAIPSLKILQMHKCGEHVFSSLVAATSSVTKLEIGSIKGLKYEVWRGVIKYFGAVEKVSMWSCNEIRYLWESEEEASKVFIKLKELEVYNCSKLLRLGKKVEDDVRSNLLSSLKMLQLWGCGRMVHSSCPNSIESLRIISCSSLKDDSLPTSTTGGGQKLKDLYIRAWANMKSIIQLSNYVHLTSLSIEDCPSIDSIPNLENLNMLNYLTIINCRSLDYSFTPKVWPPNLVTLGIGGLKMQISEWGHQEFPTSLVSLHLYGEHAGDFSQSSYLLPSSLTKLSIENFDKLKSLSVGLQHLTSLQRLFINQCPKVKHLPRTLLPSLLSLTISESPKLSRRCNGKGSYYWPHIYHIPCIRIQNKED